MDGRIKNLKREDFVIPRIGIIKVGTKIEKNGKEMPKSLDYFIATGRYSDEFNNVFGENPNKIQIVFVSDNTKQVCYERFEAWTNDGKKIGYGDGETFVMYSHKDKDYITVPSDHELVQKNKHLFKRILTLKFIIPQIRGVYGHWEFSTRATKSTINQIISTFDYIKEQAGRVSAIPFDLVVSMVQSKKPDVISKYPVVSLIPNISADNLKLISMYLTDISFGKIGVLTEDKILMLSQPNQSNLLETKNKENQQDIKDVNEFVEVKELKDGKKNNKAIEANEAKQTNNVVKDKLENIKLDSQTKDNIDTLFN